MTQNWTIAAACLAVCACASNATDPAPAIAETAAQPSEATPAKGTRDIEVAEIPKAQTVVLTPAEDKLVCTYEKRTGSHRVARVCRRQSEIDQEATAAKRTFDELHRSQREYGNRN